MNRLLRFRSIKSQLAFWFIACAIIPIVVVASVVFVQRVNDIKAGAFSKLEAVRDLKVGKIETMLDSFASDVETIAGDFEIRALADVYEASSEAALTESVEAIARALFERYPKNYPAYHEVFFISVSDGSIAMSTNIEREGLDRSDDPYFKEVIRSGSTFVKSIYRSQTLGQHAMSLSTPVFCMKHDGRHTGGVVVARIDLHATLYGLLLNRVGIGDTGETLLVDSTGLALSELRWHNDAPLNLRIAAEPALRGAAGETSVVETRDYRGVDVLAAFTHIPRVGWGFVAKQDQAEAYSSIPRAMRQISLLVCVVVILAALGGILLGGTFARPIRLLSNAAEQFEQGNTSVRCELERSDEIGVMVDAFNSMTASIESLLNVQRGLAAISEKLVGGGDTSEFTAAIVERLVSCTGSSMGAVYLREENGDPAFRPAATLGVDIAKLEEFDVEEREGEFGAAVATGEIVHLTEVPQDTTFILKTVVGNALPRQILTVPLLVEDRVAAVISLGTLTSFSADAIETIRRSQPSMCAGFASVLAARERAVLLAQIQSNNEELASGNEELKSQSDELRQRADELAEQTSELESQRAQVEEANRLKSEFLSNMSHELRTPLNSIMALSQLMISKGTDPEPNEDMEYLQVIERNGRQLLGLIDDILDLSRIEAGRMEIALSEFAASFAVHRAIGVVSPMAAEKGLEIETVIQSDIPDMQSDQERVEQILLNLLSNAVKFTEQGKIKVTLSHIDAGVTFVVEDTGIGIRSDDLLSIFDEFRQVDGSTTRRFGGTGLGLAISQRVAALLGGVITVESEPGKGSIFTLVLPLNYEDAAATASAPGDTQHPGEHPGNVSSSEQATGAKLGGDGPVRILLVEDNDVAALQVTSALEEYGFSVRNASGGAEAICCLKESSPDGVVLDLMMPHVDGFDVLESMHSETGDTDIPVIVLTAKELTKSDRERLSFSNVGQLVQKGKVNREELARLVCDLVGCELRDGKCHRRQASAIPERPVPSPVPGNGSGPLLIVEDNPDNLLTTVAILDSMGLEYISAADGHQALDLARETHPQLVLMDIQLPGMDGLTVTSTLKADPLTSGIPIVAMTARAMKGDRERIMAAGCDDYISKPVDLESLDRILKKWLVAG